MWKKIREFFFPANNGQDVKFVPVPVKKLYIIDTVATHKVRYVVECEEGKVEEIVAKKLNELSEFSQEFLGDNIVGYYLLKDEEHYLQTFDHNNDYLKTMEKEQKLSFINRK